MRQNNSTKSNQKTLQQQERQLLLLEEQRRIYFRLFEIKHTWDYYTIYYKNNNPPRSEWHFSSPLCTIHTDTSTRSESDARNTPKTKKFRRNSTMAFICDECGIKLGCNDVLIRHKRTIHGLRMQCSKCPATFNRRDNYLRHLRTYHTDLNPNAARILSQTTPRSTKNIVFPRMRTKTIKETQLKADLAL